jgi:triosephosphate isomerase
LHFQESVKRELGDSRVKMAAQSIFFEDKGAFTGSD